MQIDFNLEGGGSIYTLLPLTAQAKEWVADNLPDEALRFGDAICIEHRYIDDILAGLLNDGLTLQ
jgi:hypothetical protein